MVSDSSAQDDDPATVDVDESTPAATAGKDVGVWLDTTTPVTGATLSQA